MSGEKRSPIQIAQDNIRALQRQMTNVRSVNRNLQSAINKANKARRRDYKKIQQQISKRDKAFERSIGQLKSNMRTMETRHLNAIQRQGADFNKRVQQQGREFQARILREQQERIRDMQKQKQELEQHVYDVVGQEREERQRQIQLLNFQIAEMESELKSEISRVEAEFDQKIDLERVARSKAINTLQEWTAEVFQHQREEYLSIAAQHQRELDAVKNDIRHIFQQQINNRQGAIDFINDLEQQIIQMDEHLPTHRRFAPGELNKIRRNVQAAKNLTHGAEQAAIANAQKEYFEFVDLREKVIHQEQEYNLYHQATLEAARSLFENIRANRQVELEDNAGFIEVDYWTRGEYLALENKVNDIIHKLDSKREQLTLAEVKAELEIIHQFEKEKEQKIEEALQRVLSSQLRAEMADRIAEALQKESFTLIEKGYEQQDQRRIYILKLENHAGTEVVAAIVPDEKTNTNTLSLNTKDSRIFNESLTTARFNDIKETLQSYGLEVGETIRSDKHIEAFYDTENILKRAGEGIPKKVLEKAKLLNSQTR